MSRSTEIDSTQSIRDAMIERRDQALLKCEWDDTVLFSHVIAALKYCSELESRDEQVGKKPPKSSLSDFPRGDF